MGKKKKIREIARRIKEEKKEEIEKRKENRKGAVEVIKMIMKVVRSIDPSTIDIMCFGSYTDSTVYNHPYFKIQAVVAGTNEKITEWQIDAWGGKEPPEITEEDVIDQVLEGLGRLKATGR